MLYGSFEPERLRERVETLQLVSEELAVVERRELVETAAVLERDLALPQNLTVGHGSLAGKTGIPSRAR